VSEIYGLLRYAAAHGQPVAARYDGQPRLDCFARVSGDESQAGCTSFAISLEEAVIVLSRCSEGEGVWRGLAVEKLSQVELRMGPWHTEPRPTRQTCMDEIDFDADAQLGGDPQKGQ
jgi:hypothetical protein